MTEHRLDARPEHLFWGYFDAATPAVLEVDSGDTVRFTCLPAGVEARLPADRSGVREDHLEALAEKAADRGPGSHLMTGPVHVRGAEPGDVLQVDILSIRAIQDWGYTAILPLRGALPDEFPEADLLHVAIDPKAETCTLPWGRTLPLEPFLGVMACAPPPAWGRVGSNEPRIFGGNMDNKELRPGSTLYLPVFNAGALFSTGDGHGRQGDGEVSIAALETALEGELRLSVRKDITLASPFAETAESLVSMGFHESLDEAMRRAVRDMIALVTARSSLTRNQAYMLLSLAGDLRITQVVDGEKGVHMLLRKDWI